MTKRQVCVSLSEEMYENLQKVKKESGVPVSRQIELRLKGYVIKKD